MSSGLREGAGVDERGDDIPPPERPRRRLGPTIGFALVLASALLGSNMFGIRDQLFGSATPEPTVAAGSRVAGAAAPTTPEPTLLRSQPWWQAVTTLEGAGPLTTTPFTIGSDALQWRVKSTCETGRLVVTVPQRPKPLVDANCPGGPDGFSTKTGVTRLKVTAGGPWKLTVEQQVDVPLVEPPLATMTGAGAKPVLQGSFYKIDQSSTGKVIIYRQADGSHALRLDDFFVSPNSDLEIQLSKAKEPHSSKEYTDSPSALVATLDVTTGSLNFVIPDSIDPADYASVVIWCQAVNSAYGAATLGPAE